MKANILTVAVFVIFNCCTHSTLIAQRSPLYDNLPVGEYPVGFKIITLTDKSRVTKPLYNYFGEKDTTNRYREIKIHLWYPAQHGTGNGDLTYRDYAYAHRLVSTEETISDNLIQTTLSSQKSNMEGFFGPVAKEKWETLLETPMLAIRDAEPEAGHHPLLVGMLRPLSTTVTNELLASNGYVVAMALSAGMPNPVGYSWDIQDMQKIIDHLTSVGLVDENRIGTFGFSGSGQSQLLFAMHDFRVRVVADLESGFYGDGSFTILSSSDYYDARKLKVPFLHIYGKKLAEGDVSFDQFHAKVYSERHHLLMNYPGLHHWDIATEGRASTTVLTMRGQAGEAIKATYELTHGYLLQFFDSILKDDKESKFRITLAAFPDSLYTVTIYPALPAIPSRDEFREIVKSEGVDFALELARKTYATDSLTDFLHENVLNQIAWELKSDGKTDEPLQMLAFAAELYPKEAWLWNNLASMHEDFGHRQEAIEYSRKVVDLLKDFEGPEMSFDARIRRHAVARLERLKE